MQAQPWLNNPISTDYAPIALSPFGSGVVSVAAYFLQLSPGSFSFRGKFSRDGLLWPDDSAAKFFNFSYQCGQFIQQVTFNNTTANLIMLPQIRIVKTSDLNILIFAGSYSIGGVPYANVQSWGWT